VSTCQQGYKTKENAKESGSNNCASKWNDRNFTDDVMQNLEAIVNRLESVVMFLPGIIMAGNHKES
jgi:hypothetical protein